MKVALYKLLCDAHRDDPDNLHIEYIKFSSFIRKYNIKRLPKHRIFYTFELSEEQLAEFKLRFL